MRLVDIFLPNIERLVGIINIFKKNIDNVDKSKKKGKAYMSTKIEKKSKKVSKKFLSKKLISDIKTFISKENSSLILGSNISFFRKSRGFTQQTLSTKINCTRQCVSKLERGAIKDIMASFDTIQKIYNVLKIPLINFFKE